MHETEEKIMRKALQYFSANDYENASLNSIAKAIGITKGGIYHYFESKEDLLRRCILYFFDMMTLMLQEMIPRENEISLEELIGSFFSLDLLFQRVSKKVGIDFFSDYSTYLYLLFTGLKKFPELKTKVSEIYNGSKQGLTYMLESFKKKGKIRQDVNCEAFAMQLLVVSEGYMLFGAVDIDNTLKVRENGKDIVENLLRSLR